MKRVISVVLALVIMLAAVACGNANTAEPENQESAQTAPETQGQDPQSEDPGATAPDETAEEANPYEGMTLNVAHNMTDSNADSFLAQFKLFEELYGCTINVELLSTDADEMESVLQVRSATGNLPDIWMNSVGAKLDAMEPAENCYDLSGEAWVKERINEDYLEILTDDATGAIYGVPSMPSNVAGVFYNKQVMQELGLKVPATWDEFLESCRYIRENTDKDPVLSQYSNASGAQILFLSQYYYVQNEVPDFADQYTNKAIELRDSAPYMRGLEKMYEIWENGYQNDDPLEISWEDAATAVANGDAVYIFCRTNIMSTVETIAADKMEDIGFFPLPDESADSLGVATWMPAAWCISKNSEKTDLAVKLVEFMTTAEAIDAYCTVTKPSGAFMLNGIELPEDVSTAVKEAQAWAEKASSPVMEYYCNIKGSNMATILTMVGTGEYTPEVAIAELEADNAIDARQKGIAGW